MTTAPQITPDAVPIGWVDRAPRAVQPYLRLMRLDRPIGTWLLLIPCWQGMMLAAAQNDATMAAIPGGLWFAALFAVGAIVMRGAGCVYNDIVDRDFDAKVARSAARPIPSGQVSIKNAWALLAGLCLIGLGVLVQFNTLAIIVGASALALVAAYPFMKRITYWPQAWLGLTFNWGALVGYAAVTGALTPPAFLFYGAGIFWTLGYDTIYAHQDTEDDALIGVKSTALKFGDTSKYWLAGFYGAVILLSALAGAAAAMSPVYYIALLPALAHFVWQIKALDITDTHNCLKIFKSNRNAGFLLLSAPIAEWAAHLIFAP